MFPKEPAYRASAIRLLAIGWKVEKIAIYLKWADSTVRTAIHRWKNLGLMGLWDAPRSGRKRKWQPENIEIIAEKLDKGQRTYNTRQLLEILATLNGVYLSSRQIRRILKKADATPRRCTAHLVAHQAKLLMKKNEKLDKRKTKSP
ncbi:MAG: helix-turn-helix domain-containing protein [Crocosphaera sp.]